MVAVFSRRKPRYRNQKHESGPAPDVEVITQIKNRKTLTTTTTSDGEMFTMLDRLASDEMMSRLTCGHTQSEGLGKCIRFLAVRCLSLEAPANALADETGERDAKLEELFLLRVLTNLNACANDHVPNEAFRNHRLG